MKKLLFLLFIANSAPVLSDTINISGLIEEKSSEFRLSPGASGGVVTTKVEVHRMTPEQIAEAKKNHTRLKWSQDQCARAMGASTECRG